jgi:hypothetical protein
MSLTVTGSTRTSAQEGQLNSWVSPHPPLLCDSWYPTLHLYGLTISDSQLTQSDPVQLTFLSTCMGIEVHEVTLFNSMALILMQRVTF